MQEKNASVSEIVKPCRLIRTQYTISLNTDGLTRLYHLIHIGLNRLYHLIHIDSLDYIS